MVEHVLFLRHFETGLNAEKRICGRSLEVPILTSTPISCETAVDHIVCSTAVRCRQTLDVFLQRYPVADIRFDPDAVERNMGVMEGELRARMVEAYPAMFCNNKFRVFQTPPGGESFEVFYDRVKWFWKRICLESDGTVLICAHNQFLKMLYFVIHKQAVQEDMWRMLSFPHGVVEKVF